jgi:hypothetical protein
LVAPVTGLVTDTTEISHMSTTSDTSSTLRYVARRNDGATGRFASKSLADQFLANCGGHVLQFAGRQVRTLYEVLLLPCGDSHMAVVKHPTGRYRYRALESVR